jgi:hypothetical protein
MAVEIATAYFSLLPSMAGTAAAVRTGLGSAAIGSSFAQAGGLQGAAMGAGVAGGLSRAVPQIALALGALGVADFFGNAIDKASDLNESANAVRVTFGDAADEVARLGETSATRLGLAQVDFNALSVRFSNFAKVVAGDSRGVADVLDELTTRAADFASVMNIDVAEASVLFQSGLAGETEPLHQYGIDVSAANVQQTAWRLGIAEAGQELTEQQKVMARYAAIMEQTTQVQGDFANTSDQLANKQRINQARFDDAAAAIGTALLPAATKFAEFVGDKLIPLLEKLGPVFDYLGPGIEVVVDLLLAMSGPSILSNILDLFDALEDGKVTVGELQKLFAGLPKPLQGAISGFYDFIQASLRNLINFSNSAVKAVLAPINALRSALGQSQISIRFHLPSVPNPINLPANYRPAGFSYTPKAALGGVVGRSGMVQVGEYGPETLYLPEGAVVDPLPPRGDDLRPLMLRLIEEVARGHALYADGVRLAQSNQAGSARLTSLGAS